MHLDFSGVRPAWFILRVSDRRGSELRPVQGAPLQTSVHDSATMPEAVLQRLNGGNLRRVVVRVVTDARRRVVERRERRAGVPEEVGRARHGYARNRRDAEAVLAAELAAGADVRDVPAAPIVRASDLQRELADLVIADRAEQQAPCGAAYARCACGVRCCA